MSKQKLGRWLEWHGNRIRVVVRVPPRLVATIGATKLREALATRDPMEAEREKVDVVRRLKAKLRGEKVAVAEPSLNAEALNWRDAFRDAARGDGPDEETVSDALGEAVGRVERKHGWAAGQSYAAVALGNATPLASLLDRWFAEKSCFSDGYKGDIRRMVGRLEQWCRENATSTTVEAITGDTAGRFIHDRYVVPKVNVITANKDISALHSYWRWMKKRCGVKANPWQEQRLDKPQKRQEAASDDKRPFTDDEVRTLLGGVKLRREWEFSFFAALSGLRVNEIGGLRVKHCEAGKIVVARSKTSSGMRTIPAHPLLAALIERHTAGKQPDDYLFEGLPEQARGSKRDRAAPVSQSFTRERRRLGVEEKAAEGQRQSNVDFHSWRRWFVRRAVSALEKGGVGYTAWTIANVIGHKVEDGTIEGTALPLGMTMGVYAGAASWEAMAACVNAVALPENTAIDRADLVAHLPGGRRPKRGRRLRLGHADDAGHGDGHVPALHD
ncbi:MAG TPA: hypothetical protein VGC77_09325 [Rhodopseudomonas sp.]|uniref:tyrosine-type recombinase/integrase n=1 Tax=Rhodopseudomonas sp. TaxID=1078 RepID=UPI002ED888B0